MARTRLVCVLVVMALCGVLADAASAAVNRGVLSISPARRDLTGQPPARLVPTVVKNTTQADMKLTAYPVLLFQNLDGSFGFNGDAQDLNAARLQLSVTPQAFELKPQQQIKVALRWNLLPTTAKASYLGLVIQGIPQLGGTKSVGTVLRLLSVNFFRLPGSFTVSGHITKVTGEQAGPRVLRFKPRVKNTGQIHAQPRNGRCVIVNAGGAVQLTSSFGSGVILPGYEREYPVLVKKILPAGTYTMTCSTTFGRERSSKSLRFKLSGPNTLPTPNLKLTSVKASGQVGSGATVHVVFHNRGSAASNAVLKVSLQTIGTASRPKVIARVRIPEGSLGAGQTKTVDVSVGSRLGLGAYAADVVLSDGRQDVDELTSSFQTTAHKGFFTRLWDWLKDHLAWLIALVALLGLLILFVLYRRRRREMEEELEAARQGYVPRDPAYDRPRPRSTPSAPAPLPATGLAEPPSAPAEPAEPAAPPAPSAPPPPPPPPPSAPPAPSAPPLPPAPSAPLPPPAPSPPAPAPEPAAAAPSSAAGGRVNLNTASVEELMTLPGVGRRAAERIVAQREAKGGFTAFEDLAEIEGFHAERIKRLSGTAEI